MTSSFVLSSFPFKCGGAVALTALLALPLTSQAEPNAQMKQVLDAHGLLSPLPFEKVTPAVAKVAPSMTAAVKAVMLKEGKKAPPFTGTAEDIKIANIRRRCRCADLQASR